MKKRFAYAMALALILSTVLVGTALADGPIVYYEDTALHEVGGWEWDTEGGEGSLITNGAFDEPWGAEGPAGWTLNAHAEGGLVHFAQMEYGSGNYALGLFVRSTTKTAPGYGTAYQQLDLPAAGYYWITVHATAWGVYDSWCDSAYNSVAWYAIVDDPESVPADAWRELYPDQTVCRNDYEICNHLGRYETVWAEPGQYLVLRGEMKFPVWQDWTVFGWDDISMEGPLTPDATLEDGWQADAVVTWDSEAPR
jgi:hypothetical protein